MKKKVRFIVLLVGICAVFCLSVFGQSPVENDDKIDTNWSSVDDVFIKPERDILVKKPMSGPIKIGFSSREVRQVMGIPDSIDEEGHLFYYRHSSIYFDDNWKVQSWDNRYGNLKVVVSEEKSIHLGSPVREVFLLKGFPLRITKTEDSYLLYYPQQIIYTGENWQVEAMQAVSKRIYQTEREIMSLQEFMEEFDYYLCDSQ